MNTSKFNMIVVIVALFISSCGPGPKADSSTPAAPPTVAAQTKPVAPPTKRGSVVQPGVVSQAQVITPVPSVVGSIVKGAHSASPMATSQSKLVNEAEVKPPPIKKVMGIQVFAAFQGSNFFPRIRAVFSKPDKTPVADDFISEDGWGLSRNYKKVLPGEYYNLELSVPELESPYFSKMSRFTGEVMPRFFFGSVSFQIGEDLNARVNSGIKVKLNKQPQGKKYFDGFFQDMKGVSIYGDTFPHMLVLEPGKYTYTVYDGNKKDKLIICDENGDEATMPEDSCDFTISLENPSVVIDISSYVGIKKDPKKPGSH